MSNALLNQVQGKSAACFSRPLGRRRVLRLEFGKELGVEINTHAIGWGQEWVDVYRDW